MATSAPSAVTQLLVIAKAALPSTFFTKFDTIFGPYVPPQALLVTGVAFSEDEPATLGPNYRHEERYTISCSLSSAMGNDDEATRMAEVYALYEDIAVALANNPTLNQVVRYCNCRQLDYSPTHDAKGMSIGVLTFEVECQQRVASLN